MFVCSKTLTLHTSILIHGIPETKLEHFSLHRLKDVPGYKPGDSFNYPYWAGSVLGPIVYILAVAHALLWGFPSSIVGSIVSAFIEWKSCML